MKEKAYDPFLKLCTLQPTWISRASARQRRGASACMCVCVHARACVCWDDGTGVIPCDTTAGVAPASRQTNTNLHKHHLNQNAGRAGRTTAGVCFHLCSRRRYESLREFRESELLTTPLEELCLQAKARCCVCVAVW